MPRVMEIATPLGADVLLFHAMHAREELSRVGDCRLDLLSLKSDIDIDAILGKSVTVRLSLQDDSPRYFNGYVTRFSQGGKHGRYRRYHADVHTWPWFLTRTTDCRIFQEMTVPEIVKKVFADHPVASFKEELTGSYRSWTYCVQYRESDLNFICRLLEHEGIYFYFTHEDGKHTMVLADSYSAHEQCQDDPIPFIAPDDLARPDIEHIGDWTLTREIQPGVYAHEDYDFERPGVLLRTKKPVVRGYTWSDYEVYDYPGIYAQKGDGEHLAAVRINEYAAQFETAQAVTNVKTLGVGGLFKLERCPRPDQDGEHLIVAATYELEFSDYEAMPERGGAEYRCSFAAMPSQQEFRPRRLTPKPFMQGPQTAVVVGPAGDEIYTDKYGRIKVQFHWDRYGQRDENSSCWIRVSQTWAGKAWGSVVIPRIEQEVIVDFLEGDPDQPIVTGCVYNGNNMPPTSLPGAGVVSGLKSNTHKGRGYNEMTMDDTTGKEKISIHAQYDMHTKVLNDQSNTVLGKMTEEITKDTKITIVTGKLEHKVSTGTADYFVNGALTENFNNTWSSTAKNKISIKSATNEIYIDAKTKITLVTGSSKLVMEDSGAISLTGTKITVIGSEKVAVSSAKTSVTGSAEATLGTGSQNITTTPAKTAISGTAINSSAVGMHEISGAVVKIN